MKGIIINHDTRYIGDIIKLFYGCDVIHFKNFNIDQVESYDYVILSGGPTPDPTFENIKEEIEWIKKTEKPILGICLGIQIICAAFGGNMKRFEKNRKLNENLKFVDIDYNMLYNHSYYFDQIPQDFVGEIKNNVVVWIKHKTKPILAFQGHPEVTENGEKIKEFFLTKIIK